MLKKIENKPTTRKYESFVVVPSTGDATDSGERAVKYSRIEQDVRYLMGNILTIIDASISEEEKNKAVKDLVKKEFRDFLYRYQDICYQGSQTQSEILI